MSDLRRRLRILRRVRWGLLATDLAFVGLVIGLVFATWPARLGGRTVLVVVHGSSMEPTYHGGDLLYARSTDRYETGQAAVFRLPAGEPGAGQLVVHRIQGRTADGRYIMKGDNRPLDDGALPSADDLVARPVADLGPMPVGVLRLVPWARWWWWASPSAGTCGPWPATSPGPAVPGDRSARPGPTCGGAGPWSATHRRAMAPCPHRPAPTRSPREPPRSAWATCSGSWAPPTRLRSKGSGVGGPADRRSGR